MLKLIAELKKEHLRIIDKLSEAKQLGITTMEGQNRLLFAREYLFSHLEKEDEKFYPLLKKESETNASLKEALDIFAKDFERISLLCRDFFTKCSGEDMDRSCMASFDIFFSALKQRMRREEIVLFNISKNIRGPARG